MADEDASVERQVHEDIWKWIHEFVTAPNEFYHNKFAPCPYAKSAVLDGAVDVKVWEKGDVRAFIHENAVELGVRDDLATRVMAFPPRVQYQWGISDYVDTLNGELLAKDVFLNTGLTKTMMSRYPKTKPTPYFIVVANSVKAVLDGAEALKRTDYYKDWPKDQYELVVERRERLANRYRNKKS